MFGLGRGDAERFHFAVEMGAFEAKSAGGAGHIPAIFFEFAEDEFAFVGDARFLKAGVGLLGTVGSAAKNFGRQVMRLDADHRAHDDQAFD